MVRAVRRLMGTDVAVTVPEGAGEAQDATFDLFGQWEATLSRFRPDSELAYLNDHSGGAPVRVSQLLFAVTTLALEAARASGGLYDPTVLRALEAAGYDRSFELLPLDAGGAMPRALLRGWRHVELCAAERTVRLPAGVGLDFGGIAKGMAVDAAVALVAAMGVERALVDGGGDLRVRGLPAGADSWPVAVPTPYGVRLVRLARGAVATSGIGRRRWRQRGRLMHHLIDPRSGRPALSGLWSVSVAAQTTAIAEVAAKAAFLLGPEEGSRWLEGRGLAGLFVPMNGPARAAGSWPRAMERVG
jgi:FAD:protein FMN transferase